MSTLFKNKITIKLCEKWRTFIFMSFARDTYFRTQITTNKKILKFSQRENKITKQFVHLVIIFKKMYVNQKPGIQKTQTCGQQ